MKRGDVIQIKNTSILKPQLRGQKGKIVDRKSEYMWEVEILSGEFKGRLFMLFHQHFGPLNPKEVVIFT